MNVCLAHGGDVSQPSGGTDRVTALAAGLQDYGFKVTLVVPEPEKQLPDRLEAIDVRTVETERFGMTNALTRAETVASAARSIAKGQRAILQLEHSSLAGIGTLRGCRGFVLDMHDIAYPRFEYVDTPIAPILKRGVAYLERRAVNRSLHVVVVSEFMRQMLVDEWGVPDDRVTVIPNGYFPERIENALNIDTEPGRVCFLGTLHPKVDIKAFAGIAQLRDVTELVIVGDGAKRDRVERLAKQDNSVRVTGRLPDEEAFDLVASAEVLVNPQTRSALQRSSSPVKLFYYAALGKPMVVSSGPPIVQKLVDANAAKAADTRSEFVAHVETLLGTPSLRRELSQNARTLAKGFNWAERCGQLVSMYEQRGLEAHR